VKQAEACTEMKKKKTVFLSASTLHLLFRTITQAASAGLVAVGGTLVAAGVLNGGGASDSSSSSDSEEPTSGQGHQTLRRRTKRRSCSPVALCLGQSTLLSPMRRTAVEAVRRVYEGK
jgi:hypothetical protein